MALFPARVRIIHPAVCEEPTNSGKIRKRDFLILAAVYGVGGGILTALWKSCSVSMHILPFASVLVQRFP